MPPVKRVMLAEVLKVEWRWPDETSTKFCRMMTYELRSCPSTLRQFRYSILLFALAFARTAVQTDSRFGSAAKLVVSPSNFEYDGWMACPVTYACPRVVLKKEVFPLPTGSWKSWKLRLNDSSVASWSEA